MKKIKFLCALLLCGAVCSQAADPETAADTKKAVPEAAGQSRFRWGGDIRLRSVYFDNIPLPMGAETRGGANSFQRYRTRLWGEYQATENLKFHGRIINEFRTWQNRSKTAGSSAWNALDEIVIDNLYIDWDATENWSVRAGRQDLIYGTGKVILDGTPKDGSRTIYFDAVKATYSGIQDTTIDFLGIYTRAEDPLAIHSEERDLVGKTGSYYGGAEAGGGIYLKNQSIEGLPLEAYYLYKAKEEAWIDTTTTPTVLYDDQDRHTVGTRLMQKFTDDIDSNLELAYQFGDNISAYMVDALINWHIPDCPMKSTLGLGWYYLSGDDPSTSDDEGWNPLWARWPQYSELYIYAFDAEGAGRWSNLSMPHVDFTFHPHEKVQTSLMLGYMFAPEEDGVGGGDERGFLATLKNTFTLKKNMLTKGDKLGGHILFEAMDPGNYYSEDQQNHPALFARVELNYSF
ncbi:alginate export family protein [Tichowtungia aerotolerans]|uniref:Alginate export domain-containing protein n=1 Tax=Tichowtungia aerotolerans TaxID=2697043 RepID=A0A6P1M9R2_9BACT|nr:alginate export family protein [Tichowtungia aerotolerans]QHI70571.1 hypothetical protein GT409_14355 [Tichowtungia aerotolerans]